MSEGTLTMDALMPGAEDMLVDGPVLVAALDALGAEHALGAGAHLRLTGATIDSRTVAPGAIFFALPGAHVHGASFVVLVARKGPGE